jgi:hypothetical protein
VLPEVRCIINVAQNNGQQWTAVVIDAGHTPRDARTLSGHSGALAHGLMFGTGGATAWSAAGPGSDCAFCALSRRAVSSGASLWAEISARGSSAEPPTPWIRPRPAGGGQPFCGAWSDPGGGGDIKHSGGVRRARPVATPAGRVRRAQCQSRGLLVVAPQNRRTCCGGCCQETLLHDAGSRHRGEWSNQAGHGADGRTVGRLPRGPSTGGCGSASSVTA